MCPSVWASRGEEPCRPCGWLWRPARPLSEEVPAAARLCGAGVHVRSRSECRVCAALALWCGAGGVQLGRVVADRWFPSSNTCSDCGATKAKLPLHVRVFTCDLCGLVMDRDENAARNLAALAAARTTGTGVAGDQDTPGVSKPRGADRETRRQHPGQSTGRGGRAGGASLPHQRQKETGDRRQDTEAQPTHR
ncbi:zinc ribbon domain-containing protein [Streptomyces sp. NBC_01017]|uniref:zinc ribbon domain-containing protein n=1 Tax=Streptomyces sp. NBC_01017 TaxID=2903721 RepID=UPI003868D7BE